MSRKVKGSIYRKRYLLVYADTDSKGFSALENNLFKLFRCRKKYFDPPYVIFRTNQFYKDRVIEHIRKNFEFCKTITVSGTIKKCKKVMQEHKSYLEMLEQVD